MTRKQVTLMLEPVRSKGGMDWAQIKVGLAQALSNLHRWGLDEELEKWYTKGETRVRQPTLPMLTAALVARPHLLYSGINSFLDISLRMVAQKSINMSGGFHWRAAGAAANLARKLKNSRIRQKISSSGRKSKTVDSPVPTPAQGFAAASSRSRTYQLKDIVRIRLRLPPPRGSRAHHLFVSAHNEGAVAMVSELREMYGMEIITTSDPELIAASEFFVVYLDARTWCVQRC